MPIWRPPANSLSGPHVGFSWDRSTGPIRSMKWDGLRGVLEGMVPTLKAVASRIEIAESEGPWTTLRAYFNNETPDQSADANEITTWEIEAQDDQKPIQDCSVFRQMSRDGQAKFMQGLADFQEGELNAYPAFSSDDAALGAGELLTVATQSGVFSDDSWILRKSLTIDYKNQLRLTLTGLNKVWTSAQIINAEDSLWQSVANAMNIINNFAPPAVEGYAWGWLKKKPSFTTKSFNKLEVTQTWWLEQWPTVLYPAYV